MEQNGTSKVFRVTVDSDDGCAGGRLQVRINGELIDAAGLDFDNRENGLCVFRVVEDTTNYTGSCVCYHLEYNAELFNQCYANGKDVCTSMAAATYWYPFLSQPTDTALVRWAFNQGACAE